MLRQESSETTSVGNADRVHPSEHLLGYVVPSEAVQSPPAESLVWRKSFSLPHSSPLPPAAKQRSKVLGLENETPNRQVMDLVGSIIWLLFSVSGIPQSDTGPARTLERNTARRLLSRVELEPQRKKVRENLASRRASNKGCVLMLLAEYPQLLDWTGRQLKPGKLCSIPKTAPTILDQLNMSPDLWLHAVE